MSDKVLQIQHCISGFGDIRILKDFCAYDDGTIRGAIEAAIPNGFSPLKCKYCLSIRYSFMDTKAIRFVNPALKNYNHVRPDGSVCVHTHHSPKLTHKLKLDFGALQQWIDTYYLGHKEDEHYEHIFVNTATGVRDVFLFTDIDHEFKRGDYGTLKTEYQINDRMSFMRFLGLTIADDIPDSKTVWRFRRATR